MEAWSLVRRAIQNSLYHADEEYSKLPPIVQKAVGSPDNLRGWAAMDAATVSSVTASNFIRTYSSEVEQAAYLEKIPGDVRDLLTGSNTLMITQEREN